MILTKNIKAVVLCPEGELVFEFRRPTNKEKNVYLASTLEAKVEGAARLDALDELRIAMFNKYAVDVYVEKPGGIREDVLNEDQKKIGPQDVPDDIKVDAAAAIFDRSRVLAKNV